MYYFYMKFFKAKLKELRKNNFLTQAQLAKQLCVSKQTIAKWEEAKQEPTLKSLIKLCKFFDVRLHDLIGVDED